MFWEGCIVHLMLYLFYLHTSFGLGQRLLSLVDAGQNAEGTVESCSVWLCGDYLQPWSSTDIINLILRKGRQHPPKTECGCLHGGGNWKRSHTQSSHPMDYECTCTCAEVGEHSRWPSECSAEERYNNNQHISFSCVWSSSFYFDLFFPLDKTHFETYRSFNPGQFILQ